MAERLLTLHPAKGGKDFVGIQFSDNKIDFYYPETFRFKNCTAECEISNLDDDTASGIRAIISSIAYAKTRSLKITAQNDFFDNDEAFAMKSYIWMIRDYMKNGFYKNREIVFKANQKGKVNWKRTLSKLPIFSEGNFIYNDMVVSAKSQADNILVEIYDFCVKKSVYLIGWLFGISSSTFKVRKPTDIELSANTKKRYIYSIKYELNRTFDDEKRLRLNNMLNVIRGLNKSEKGQLVYGVDNFDHVFEYAVDKVFGTIADKSLYYPHGVWHNKSTDQPVTPLRIDSILKTDELCIIIDSKCYRFADIGYTNDTFSGLPDTDSIQKQITYGDSVQRLLPADFPVYNCFLLPYNRTIQYGKNAPANEFLFSTEIFATADWRNDIKYVYEKILVIFIDMRDVIEKSLTNTHIKEQANLIKLIKKATS